MEFFRISRDIPFMRHALAFNVISLVTFIAAVIFLAVNGLNLGVDFRGGTVIEVTYGHPVDFTRVRSAIDKLNLGEFSIQSFGASNTALVRLPLKEGLSSAQLSERVMQALKGDDASATQQRVEPDIFHSRSGSGCGVAMGEHTRLEPTKAFDQRPPDAA